VKATGVDAIFFSVNDVPRAIAFYRELLDVTDTTFENEHGAEWVLSDGSAFGVGKLTTMEQKPSGCVLFAVPNVDDIAKQVPDLGGKLIDEIRTFPHCKAQWCEDPDGNTFVLHQRIS